MAEIRIKVITLVIAGVCLAGALFLALLLGAAIGYGIFEGQLTQARAQAARLERELAQFRGPVERPVRRTRQPSRPAPAGFDPVMRPAASVNPGDIINVNFAGEGKQGRAAIGKTSSDLWNRYHFPYAGHATLEDLKNLDGRATGALLQTHSLPGEWGWTCADPMWGTFSYSETDEGCLRFPNLPAGTYHLYVFGHSAGDPNPEEAWENSTRTQVEACGKDYGVLATEPSREFLSLEWKKGIHYVVFENVEITNGGMLNITLLRGGRNAKPTINGLQLERLR
jgi:hypothetical protein